METTGKKGEGGKEGAQILKRNRTLKRPLIADEIAVTDNDTYLPREELGEELGEDGEAEGATEEDG